LKTASIVKTITVSGTVDNIILGAEYVWPFLGASGGSNGAGLSAVSLSSGQTLTPTGFGVLYYATRGILNGAGTALYVSSDGISPDDMQEIAVPSGSIGTSTTWPYHGDYADCGPYWLSADASRVYTACGTVVHASSDPALDMYYRERYPSRRPPWSASRNPRPFRKSR
jgi:hypothetical protein